MSENYAALAMVLASWVLIIALGAIVSVYAIRAWRQSHERSMGFLSLGLVFISVAAGVTWYGLWFAGQGLEVCELGSTGFMVGGFGSILYSLKTRSP